MKKFVLSVAALSVAIGASTAHAGPWTPVPDSTIAIGAVQAYCIATQPYISVQLLINASDAGRPGLVYVASHDPDQTMGEGYSSGGWEVLQSQMLPILIIARSGLVNTTLNIPMNNPGGKQGWSLYVGYGVLTDKDEAMVQQSMVAVAKMRAAHPERQVPSIDPDYQRRVLIQQDMTKNAKYKLVRKWTPDIAGMCQPPSSGG